MLFRSDAMEGPTPVSALIHAATMVAAGVFLVARVYPLMEATPPDPVTVEVAELTAPGNSTNRTLSPALSLSEREREKPLAAATNTNVVVSSTAAGEQGGRTAMPPLPGVEGRGEGEPPSHHSTATVSTALQTVTWIGAITALFAALVAVAQTDIKRILAYSTVSQLGFMFLGLGAGGVAVGMFHLLTHAFFKALLFLGSGSVIHGCHEEQDIRRMGGLRKFMPVTFATYAVGMMALSGVPLFFSGFWSKDEILHAAWLWQPSEWKLPFLFGLAGAFFTAFYMTRQMWYVFFGQSRAGIVPAQAGMDAADPVSTGHGHADAGQAKRLPDVPHESPPLMTFPLAVLAVCAIGLSVFGTPVWPWFHSYLSGHAARASGTIEVGTLLVMAVSGVVALGGIALGWRLYSRRGPRNAAESDPLERLFPDTFKVLRGKFFIDELYEISVFRWNAACARACRWLDDVLWAGVVRAVSMILVGLSWFSRTFDELVVNPGFDRGCGGLRGGARWLALWQNGQVQRYLRIIGLSLTLLGVVFIWGCK